MGWTPWLLQPLVRQHIAMGLHLLGSGKERWVKQLNRRSKLATHRTLRFTTLTESKPSPRGRLTNGSSSDSNRAPPENTTKVEHSQRGSPHRQCEP